MRRAAFLKFRGEYFLLLLPLFFILHRYAEHAGEITLHQAVTLFLRYGTMLIAVSILLTYPFGSFRKAGIYTFLLACLQFFFGTVHDWVKEVAPGTFWVKYSFILPTVLITFVMLFIGVRRAQGHFQRLTNYVNTLLLILIVVDLLKLGSLLVTNMPVQAAVDSGQVPSTNFCDTCVVEDIHLVIADGYAGSQELQDVLQFDNTGFLDSLRARGFHVVDSTMSNYNYSAASMASMFQMNYLPELQGRSDAEIFKISSALLKKNHFADFLKSRGYEIRNYSIFDFAQQPPFQDGFYARGTNLITNHTFSARLNRDIGFHAAFTLKIHSELERLENHLKEEAGRDDRKMDSVLTAVARKNNSPRFFYTHLLMPHGPYYYDSQGRFIGFEFHIDQRKHLEEKKNYLEYLQYCNRKLLAFIDRIRTASARPPVIMLMSDHGLRHHTIPTRYHFSSLNAVFLPSGDYKGFYKGISNVNHLRVLLNKYSQQKYPLLKDSSIFLGWTGM